MLNVPYGKVKGLTGGIHVLGDHFQENKILGLAEILKDV
jgi:Asp-tRNA(Asn)/Glu-tRNA(Gln) amidotransferase A subunit family amidase